MIAAAVAACAPSGGRGTMPGRAELRRVWSAAVPIASSERMHAIPRGDTLHVFAQTGAEPAEHLTVGAGGQIATSGAVDFDVTGAAGCQDALLVAGADADERPVLAILDAAGRERSRSRGAGDALPTLGPFALCAAGTPVVLWETVADETSTLWIARASAGALSAPRPHALGDLTIAMAASAVGDTPVVARLAGIPPHLELVSPERGKRLAIPMRDGALVAAAGGPDRITVGWLGPSGGAIQAFDAALSPIGGPTALPGCPPDAGAPARIELYAGSVVAVTATCMQGPRGEMTGAARTFVSLGDRWTELPDGSGFAEAGGWLGDTLVIVQGGAQPGAVGLALSR